MKGKTLVVGDLHLTDKARDAYRFNFFKWLRRQQDKYSVAATFLAGDLTDAKDRHSATLVNTIVSKLSSLRAPVHICCGNHDYRDPETPFFRFLNHVGAGHIFFHVIPELVPVLGNVAIIPHYKTQEEFDAAVRQCSQADLFLVHQTFEGAIAESGTILSGLRASLIESLKPRLGVLAGDVHKPQRQGIVTYIGCPYHVRFGDGFTPRVLLIDEDGKKQNLYYDAPFKWSMHVTCADDVFDRYQLAEGDQVKITVNLTREEALDWKEIKAGILDACKEMGVDVYGCKLEIDVLTAKRKIIKSETPVATFDDFCSVEKIPTTIKEVGKKIMGEDVPDK